MNFIKVISVLLLPLIAFSYSYFYYANGTLQSTQIAVNYSMEEVVITKLATNIFSSMSVEATISSLFLVNRTNTLVINISFPSSETFSPMREFEIFYSLINTIFTNFPSINYIEFVRPIFVKYISTKYVITRDEVKYEDR